MGLQEPEYRSGHLVVLQRSVGAARRRSGRLITIVTTITAAITDTSVIAAAPAPTTATATARRRRRRRNPDLTAAAVAAPVIAAAPVVAAAPVIAAAPIRDSTIGTGEEICCFGLGRNGGSYRRFLVTA
jgi:hypothetical protein